MSQRSVLVYGGAGQLGVEVVSTFRSSGWLTHSVDLRASAPAAQSHIISGQDLKEDAKKVLAAIGSTKFDAVLCVAGGWGMGSIGADDIFDSVDRMYKLNLQSALISSHIAARTLNENGLLLLTGAKGALNPTPGSIGYGIVKAATHHLIASLASNGSGLPAGSTVVGILPNLLDTATNRRDMPNANFDDWTPLSEVANKIVEWADNKDRPKSGQLLVIETQAKKTSWNPVN